MHLDELDARRRRDPYCLGDGRDLFLGELFESLASRPNIGDLDPISGRHDTVEQQPGGDVRAPGAG
jgi:hypothetical protein